MCTEFPLDEIETDFGLLVDPTIVLLVRTVEGYRPFEFILDSGADFTMVPRRMAERIGVDLAAARKHRVEGIEGLVVAVEVGHITVQIGGREVELPCLFHPRKGAPFLLGRAGLFSRFNITLDNRGKKIVLEPLAERATENTEKAATA